MQKLPVIVGFGGISAAGRSSFHHGYRRMVHEALDEVDLAPMFKGLSRLMKLPDESDRQTMLDGTLIRQIEPQTFDIDNVKVNCKTTLQSDNEAIKFQMSKSQLPARLPPNWQVEDLDDGKVNVVIDGEMEVMVEDAYRPAVTSAAQLPSGFDPSQYYNARNQPKGLQLAVFGASDALRSMGIEWETVLEHIQPDEVSVYAASAIGQLDDFGGRGLAQARLMGGRATSKQMPLMLTQMPADFVNSYLINSVGSTGANIGACATFLYNLRQGVGDIRAGRARVVIVGSAEAPVEPEVIEGFKAMSALAEDSKIAALDGEEQCDHRRASRPFAENVGFTIGESSQFVVLMDDELALEIGATIYGSVPDVFVNADANKKSISSPGVGNYLTVAKCMALVKNILGEEGVKQTYASAHGTSTPQNRVTESHILNEVAKAFGIEKWPVAAIKAYVGHPLGPAGGDQLVAALGVWEYGYIPGIKTTRKLADDVLDSNLEFCLDHKFVGRKGDRIKGVVLNSKGFGGNNASGLVLSPQVTMKMLETKYGVDRIATYEAKNAPVRQAAEAYDEAVINGDISVIYNFGTDVMQGDDLAISTDGICLSRFKNKLEFDTGNPFSDYCPRSFNGPPEEYSAARSEPVIESESAWS